MLRFALLLVMLGLPASAQTDAGAQARAASADMAAAVKALEQAKGGPDQVAALTQTIRAYEEGLGAMRDGLRRVTIREQALQRQFDAKRAHLSQLLGVMMAMQSTPGPLQLLDPAGPLANARSGMILSEVSPALQGQAETLRGQLEEVALLRQLQQSAADTLAEGLGAVQTARTRLAQAIADRTDLPRRLAESPEDLKDLLTSVDTLDSFADLLSDAQVPPENPVQDFASAKGTLPLPVLGRLLRAYDTPDAAGIARPGLVIATRPRALVTTPWPATLRYLGPLLDYGNVMILEPAPGYLLVLAGLDLVYGRVGDVLPQGTPVGLMGGAEAAAGEFLASAAEGGGEDRTETLYMELRQGAGDTPAPGQPAHRVPISCWSRSYRVTIPRRP